MSPPVFVTPPPPRPSVTQTDYIIVKQFKSKFNVAVDCPLVSVHNEIVQFDFTEAFCKSDTSVSVSVDRKYINIYLYIYILFINL